MPNAEFDEQHANTARHWDFLSSQRNKELIDFEKDMMSSATRWIRISMHRL